jgi:hypothetical protein
MVQANHTSSEQYSPSSQLPSKYTRFTPLWRWYYFGYLTGIVGTGIWGYGDLLLRLVS